MNNAEIVYATPVWAWVVIVLLFVMCGVMMWLLWVNKQQVPVVDEQPQPLLPHYTSEQQREMEAIKEKMRSLITLRNDIYAALEKENPSECFSALKQALIDNEVWPRSKKKGLEYNTQVASAAKARLNNLEKYCLTGLECLDSIHLLKREITEPFFKYLVEEASDDVEGRRQVRSMFVAKAMQLFDVVNCLDSTSEECWLTMQLLTEKITAADALEKAKPITTYDGDTPLWARNLNAGLGQIDVATDTEEAPCCYILRERKFLC